VSATTVKTFTEADNGTTISTIALNESFRISLKENPTTGYTWNVTVSPGLILLSDNYIAPKDAMPGAGGVHEWNLKAIKSGNQTFNAIYKRSWEKTVGNETAFVMTFQIPAAK
jgi:inhibitor of cysteine peptidase